ncbi:1277_t:CDS:2, partial [Ambispora leptoticha]
MSQNYLNTQNPTRVTPTNPDYYSSHIFLLYILRNDINQTQANANNEPTYHNTQPHSRQELLSPWIPSPKLLALLHQFNTKILYDHPHIPCCYCSILMFESTTQWITVEPNAQYTLPLAFPEIPIHVNANNTKVAICASCKTKKTRRFPPILSQIPPEIQNVPMYHRKYLSPIRLFCSLGRAVGSNPYTTYRFLKGDISLNASMWLKENNPLLNRYKDLYNIAIPRSTESIPTPLPTATQITPTNSYSSNLPQLVVPNHSFLLETHNEDYRYTNLLAGIIKLDNRNFPISYNDKNLEAMIFPDLFPMGKETSINDLIKCEFIRADLPDPVTEPLLYQLVSTYQIYRCRPELCQGPGTDTNPCKKGFSQPLSITTHVNSSSLRYTYKRLKQQDRWVVLYNPETLLIWQGHINFQYVTTNGFAKYVTKYVTKPEPSELFTVSERDDYLSTNMIHSQRTLPTINSTYLVGLRQSSNSINEIL